MGCRCGDHTSQKVGGATETIDGVLAVDKTAVEAFVGLAVVVDRGVVMDVVDVVEIGFLWSIGMSCS